MENKQEICDLLTKTLQKTNYLEDLKVLRYSPKDPDFHGLETVTAVFNTGSTKKINVEMDSGCSMIADIVKALKP